MPLLRVLLAFAVAVSVTALVSSAISTTMVLQNLAAMGTEIPPDVRLETYFHDFLGFAPVYAAVVAVGFLIAFLIAELIIRLLPALRIVAFTAAGGAAIFAALTLMEALLFEMPLIAAARTDMGVVGLVGAGALGGWIYARLS